MSSVGWPLEQAAYWLDGLVRLAYILDDPVLKQKAQARLDPVVAFPLHHRLPAWSAEPAIQINGRAITAGPDAQGYAKVQRVWKPGDVLCLELPMAARLIEGRELSHPEGKPTNPYACVYYGPLLMALPVPHADPNTPIAGAKWNYALDVDAARQDRPIQVLRSAMPEEWRWQLDAPLRLRVPARQFDWRPTPAQPLPKEPVEEGPPATITLVPYGCTKFRVSMFPVAAHTKPLGHYALDYDTATEPALQAQLQTIDTRLRNKYGMTTEETAVGVLDLKGLRLAMIHPDRIEYAASVAKVGILLAYFQFGCTTRRR